MSGSMWGAPDACGPVRRDPPDRWHEHSESRCRNYAQRAACLTAASGGERLLFLVASISFGVVDAKNVGSFRTGGTGAHPMSGTLELMSAFADVVPVDFDGLHTDSSRWPDGGLTNSSPPTKREA